MRISFFEEFPTKVNLSKLKLVDFPTRVYAAAKSMKEYDRIKKDCSKYMYVQDVAYWPVLREEEGYWFSAFSDTQGIQRTIKELKKNKSKLTILWDAELPTLNKSLILRNAKSAMKNKKLIMDFLKSAHESNINVVTAEYAIKSRPLNSLFKLSAVKFEKKQFKHEKILMAYSSMLKLKSISSLIMSFKRKYKAFKLGIGLLATGIQGNEPVMTPEQLNRDLKDAKAAGVEEVVIFRLGGLTKSNIKTIKKYV